MQRIETPRHLICTISGQIYLKPVTVYPSGHVYEQDMIDKVMAIAASEGKKPLCPLSKKPIETYVTAWAIISAVDDHLQTHPDDRENQYKRDKNFSASQKNTNMQMQTAAMSATTSPRAAENSSQMQEDETLARELQRNEDDAAEAAMRERRAHAAARELRERREREQSQQTRSHVHHADNRQPVNVEPLNAKEKKERDTLVNDIQNLIFALKFEDGPQPRGRIDNFSLLFFALIESAFLEPLPWQKIKVEEGPKPTAMYEVLKAAIRALKELDPVILNTAIQAHDGLYDRVKTKFGGEVSLSKGGYASFARVMGTIKNQPGYLVDQILLPVTHMLQELCRKYPNASNQNIQRLVMR